MAILNGTSGNDTLEGTSGDDVFFGSSGDDSLIAGAGFDVVDYSGLSGPVYVDLNMGFADKIADGYDLLSDFEAVVGTGDDDTLIGIDGAHSIYAGAGNDTIYGGGRINDAFSVLFGGNGDDEILAIGDVVAIGGAGNDRINGEALGNEDIDFIRLSYESSPAGIGANLAGTANGGLGAGSANAGGGFQISDGFGDLDTVLLAHVLGDSRHDDSIFVDAAYRSSFGNWVEIRLSQGDDEVTFDNVETARISYFWAGGGVNANMVAGTATDAVAGAGQIGSDVFTGANEFRGSAFADTVTGVDAAKRLRGEAGDDVIVGGSTTGEFVRLDGEDGNDTITGVGNAFIRGGAGDDHLRGQGTDPNLDFIAFSHEDDPHGIRANLTSDHRLGLSGGTVAGGFLIADGHGGTDNVAEGHLLTATRFDDVVHVDGTWTNSFGNWLELRLGAGDDLAVFHEVATARISYRDAGGGVRVNMERGRATDVIDGDDHIGRDRFQGANEFRGSQFDDIVIGQLGNDKRLRGDAGNDVIRGRAGDDRIEGESGDDLLIGGTGNDSVFGGSGNDRIVDRGIPRRDIGETDEDEFDEETYAPSPTDDDIYTGGSGADTFVFNRRAGFDRITDFQAGITGTDVIDVSAWRFQADTAFQKLLSRTTDTAEGALIEFNEDKKILLEGVTKADLHQDGFLF